MLVQITLCKCHHPKLRPGGAESAVSAGEGRQEYEQVDGGEGGVAVSGPTYEEVGRGGNTVELKENEAYGMAIAITK